MDYDEEVPMPLLEKWTKDLREASKVLSDERVRWAVDVYYQIQDFRLAARNQAQSAKQVGSKGKPEPNAVVAYLNREMKALESRIKTMLHHYSSAKVIGQWAMATYGVGPVISAGYIASVDMNIADSAGSVWKLCGVAPGQRRAKGQKTDFNPRLKRLTWLLGQSFMKFSGRDECYYGHIYIERKDYEWPKNLRGEYRDQAEASLREKKIDEDTDAYVWYAGCLTAEIARQFLKEAEGLKQLERTALLKKLAGVAGSGIPMLPPARIELRAERYAAKMWLSHFFEVAYFVQHNKLAPAPFPITHLGHIDRVECPNKHLVPGMLEAEKS